MKLLEGKVALVTGATKTKGLGRAIAEKLAEMGAKVVLTGRNSSKEGMEQNVADIKAAGGEAMGVLVDVSNQVQVDASIADVVKAYGSLDILVNNAAVNPVFGPVLNTDNTAFDKIIQVNLKGPFELAKLVHSSMAARGGGSIINISSIGGISPEAMLGIYSVSKAAVISLTKVMAKEWGPEGIRVNVICPGLIKTKFSEALWSNEKILNSVLRQQPLEMLAEPEDVAGLALLLASDAGKFCSGGIYTADGGYTI